MNASLFQEIQHYMEMKQWSKTDLANHSGIHISEISRIFNHKHPLSLRCLDAITNALGLAEGALYSCYIEECFNEKGHLDKRRGSQFLYKCAAEKYKELCDEVLTIMLEEKLKTIRNKNLTYIFSVAEQLFQEGKEREALRLYEVIIESMPDRFSEQVAISYFRRFYIVRLTEKAEHALVQVLEHMAYIPEDIRKEAVMWVMAMYYRREEWLEVLHYAERLERMTGEGEYYARAIMYKGFALTRLGASIEEVLALTDQYAKVDDFFADMAIGNRYVTLLDYGYLEYVDEYLTWLEERADIYVGLPRVLEAYVHLNRLDDASRLLDKFRHVIEDMAVSKEPWLKEKMYLDFRYAYALYQCKRSLFSEGITTLLDVAYAAYNIRNMERFHKCLLSFWKYRYDAAPHQEEQYIQLLSISESRKNRTFNFLKL
ncbi:helix-turn-helix transcriptional regulator [Bacillus sp. 165]|uniref:helix-turn-helix domain-containing protein n=1 Tax=Bacillus sp. 165 TaxID=1529117 RepID=UPI001ADC2A3A|nr:helix-turn-helix transcriptional regulator [Bacillus sp. 165]MBO9130752.1 helix-turn-helix transcriptional regulator [Bacillus sp. 165]